MKNLERSKHLKTKSIENTTEEILDEVDVIPASTSEKSDQNGDLKIDKNILQSVWILFYLFKSLT